MKKLIYFTLIALIYFNTGIAQSDKTSSGGKIPTLNGHTFPSLNLIRSSFVSTNLQADVGFGKSTVFRIPGIDIIGHELEPFEGSIMFVNMRVQYQQRFTPWLALYFSMTMAGRLGTDMSTILADGVNTLSGGDIGWLIRILHKDKFNLSGTINIKNMTGNFINVSEFIKEVINDNPYPSLIKKVPAMTVGCGILGAYAISPSVGLQFHVGGAYGESFVRETTKGYFIGGITGDVDFQPKYRVPLGLALGYTITSAPEVVMNDGSYSNLIMAKLGYTGSDEFELGLQYAYSNVKIDNVDEEPTLSKIILVLKFYF